LFALMDKIASCTSMHGWLIPAATCCSEYGFAKFDNGNSVVLFMYYI
jgi:hypothetical protein